MTELYQHPVYPGIQTTRCGEVYSYGKCLKGSDKTYPQVYVRDVGKLRSKHRLVFEAVSGKPLPAYERKGDGLEVNHIDGNTRNAAFDNLELTTHTQNMRHSWQVLGKRQALAPGVLNASAKLTVHDIHVIFIDWYYGATYAELGRRFGVHESAISRIISGEQYQRESQQIREELGL